MSLIRIDSAILEERARAIENASNDLNFGTVTLVTDNSSTISANRNAQGAIGDVQDSSNYFAGVLNLNRLF
jgi:type VII secretion effector (TIGR04197 family)